MSITKVGLAPGELESLVRAAFGSSTRVVSARSPDNGMYNAAYLLELSGGGPARVFLKAAPPDAFDRLTYERGMMQAEIAVLRAASSLENVPQILAADLTRRHVDRDCLFMEALEGEPLSTIRSTLAQSDLVHLRRQIGHMAGSVGTLTAPIFGYPGNAELQASTWMGAFRRFIVAIFDDAKRFDITLPLPADELAGLFEGAVPLLAGIATPRLVHYDLWDGNFLVRQDRGQWVVSGVIDWERAFYGDPLAEIVSLLFFQDEEQLSAVLERFAERSRIPAKLDDAATRRLALYKAYLWMIMIVEAKPRGFGGSILLPGLGGRRRLLRDLSIANGIEPSAFAFSRRIAG